MEWAQPKTSRFKVTYLRHNMTLSVLTNALAEEVWQYIMTKSRDQDMFYSFSGLQTNPKARHFVAEKFKADFAPVR